VLYLGSVVSFHSSCEQDNWICLLSSFTLLALWHSSWNKIFDAECIEYIHYIVTWAITKGTIWHDHDNLRYNRRLPIFNNKKEERAREKKKMMMMVTTMLAIRKQINL
jgi:hypothetical protein